MVDAAFYLGFLPVRWSMKWSKIWAVEGFQGSYVGLICDVEVWRLARMEVVNRGSVRGWFLMTESSANNFCILAILLAKEG